MPQTSKHPPVGSSAISEALSTDDPTRRSLCVMRTSGNSKSFEKWDYGRCKRAMVLERRNEKKEKPWMSVGFQGWNKMPLTE
ncbi:hypothetical protein AA313_de0201171 [Arthrobotrys entomopaga]|nr:hypothetical protein AA313_de0201171 [Arthrobotrys entomopaga]